MLVNSSSFWAKKRDHIRQLTLEHAVLQHSSMLLHFKHVFFFIKIDYVEPSFYLQSVFVSFELICFKVNENNTTSNINKAYACISHFLVMMLIKPQHPLQNISFPSSFSLCLREPDKYATWCTINIAVTYLLMHMWTTLQFIKFIPS